MLRKIATAAAVFGFGVSALAAGFDGKTLATNDWFDADFTTGIAVGSAVVANSTTGITYGAGSWTSVPATGTATIVADSDAGEGATMLAINAPGEELTFTPDAQGSPTGMETSSLLVKGDAVDELPAMGADVQAAFAICDDGTAAVPCGYTAAGWTNLVYSGAMSGLTNAWCTVYVDFANVENVRYVRYSVQPAGGDVTVLADAGGTTWFQAGCNATTITSVSLSGTGSCRTINGDRLVETVSYVATYNGVSYQTLEDALAAGLADNWANGSVILVDDVTWRPTVRGAKYLIDRGAYTLDIVDASVSVSANNITNTVNGLAYYWIGGGTGSWTETANWSLYDGGAAAGAYPNGENDTAFFTADANITLNSYVNTRFLFTSGTLTLSGNGSGGIRVNSSNNTAPMIFGGTGTLRLAGVSINIPYTTQGRDYNSQISNNIEVVSGTTNYVKLSTGNSRYAYAHIRGRLTGGGCLIVYCGNNSNSYRSMFYGDLSSFTGTLVSSVPHNRGILLDQGAASGGTWSGMALGTLQIDDGCGVYLNSKSGEFGIGELVGTGVLYADGGTDGVELVLNVGGGNTDFASGVTFTRYTSSSKDVCVRKVGTGTMDYQLVHGDSV